MAISFNRSNARYRLARQVKNDWLLTGKINNLNEDDFLQIYKLSKSRFRKEKFDKLISLVKNNPINYNDTMLDRIRYEPRRFETGDSVSQDKVSHECSRHLRKVFYKNMQVIIHNNPEWYNYYKRKCETKETCVAYGHLIKKVLKAIYFITKNDVAYDLLKAGGVKLLVKFLFHSRKYSIRGLVFLYSLKLSIHHFSRSASSLVN